MIHLVLQVHITGRCNLNCKHCYIAEHAVEMPYSDFKQVLHDYNNWARKIREITGQKVIQNLHITGGEPLLHSQFNKILYLLLFHKKRYRIAFMTNGTLINKKHLRFFKMLKIKPLQLSLDGNEEGHDFIRGKGNYNKVIHAMDLLHEYNIPCRISFTANKNNYNQFPEVADICRKHNVSSLWSDRYIPYQKCGLSAIDKECMQNYVEILRNERNCKDNGFLCVENARALQFLGSDDAAYYCRAGEYFMAVDENGEIFPCRRLPISCGNIKHSTLLDVYLNSEVFKDLRKHRIPSGCRTCEHSKKCLGGAKCMSYALTGDYNIKDPSCFIGST